MSNKKSELNKLVVVINGKGGVGKDALCEALSSAYLTENVSAITPIKEIASQNGWNGEKDEKSRKFLSDLKRIFVDYNDLPTKYLVEQYSAFLRSEKQVLFVHIRENDQIAHFVSFINTPCITLLVRRKAIDELQNYGNESDDNVAMYPYDYYFDNDLPLEESCKSFIEFFNNIWNVFFL